MKEIIFNKKTCGSYKDFYKKICVDLDKESFIDWAGQYENLCFSADMLNEFLWYNHDENILFKFIGYNKESLISEQTVEGLMWGRIFRCIDRFCSDYPNNKVEYMD